MSRMDIVWHCVQSVRKPKLPVSGRFPDFFELSAAAGVENGRFTLPTVNPLFPALYSINIDPFLTTARTSGWQMSAYIL